MITKIAEFALMTPRVDRLAAFYVSALGFAQNGFRLTLGDQVVRLMPAQPGARPMPEDSTATDLWFQHFAIVTTNIAESHARAMAHGAAPITRDGPQTLPRRSGGVTAWKFRDPDGHPLELLQFPAHATPKSWDGLGGFNLGIDHSAICVADIDASILFYHERYGFVVSTRQRNFGTEQSLLDGVPNADAEIVGLELPHAPTPHLELLGYHPPGLAARLDLQDIAATRTVLAATSGIRDELARDPDGHLICMQSRPNG